MKSSETRHITLDSEKPIEEFKADFLEWENELPFRRFELVTDAFEEELSEELVNFLDEQEVDITY